MCPIKLYGSRKFSHHILPISSASNDFYVPPLQLPKEPWSDTILKSQIRTKIPYVQEFEVKFHYKNRMANLAYQLSKRNLFFYDL